MSQKVSVENPYAKKRKAASELPSTTSSPSTAAVVLRQDTKSSSNNSTRKPVNNNTKDALLPLHYAIIPGSFSQAFTSIDETEDFRRVSESFESNIRGNKKREFFQLAEVKRGRRSKSNSIFEEPKNSKDDIDDRLSSSPSNRGRERSGKQQNFVDGASDDHKTQRDSMNSNETAGDKEGNPIGSSSSTSISATTTGDVRIHHTMLQPHVLYVSTRQKGNKILELVRNVPIAYSPMVPDYIFGATSCALFLSIKYHKLYPRYIHRRIAELRKDFKLRILLVLVDMDDNLNALLHLNAIGVTNQLTIILCWSELEAARYLEMFKTRDGKDAAPIQKKESSNQLDCVVDFLTGGRAGVNKTDAVSLWNQFSTISGVASASRDELALVGGMGPVKVRRLHEAIHNSFRSLRPGRTRIIKRNNSNKRGFKNDD